MTDHNAHAWVEAWFPGYGWLPFDPTPGRGSLAASYSASSTGFNAGDAAEAFGGASGPPGAAGPGSSTGFSKAEEALADRQGGQGVVEDDRDLRGLWLLVLVLVAVGLSIGAVKLVRRRLRYLTRDPRRTAAAARLELADFLADQGVEIEPSATPAELHGSSTASCAPTAARSRPRSPRHGSGRRTRPERRRRRPRRELRALLRVIRHGLGRWARLRGFVTVRSLRA